jgi:hypothetical protein
MRYNVFKYYQTFGNTANASVARDKQMRERYSDVATLLVNKHKRLIKMTQRRQGVKGQVYKRDFLFWIGV